ncbi:MAG: GLUG motif-containing protein [Candidatus Thermoplasmatota archaeon]
MDIEKKIAVSIAFVLVLTAFLPLIGIGSDDSSPSLSFSGVGSGTETDPYQITNWTHMEEVGNDLSAYYLLMNDIDRTTDGYSNYASDSANGGDGWAPIGNIIAGPFEGNFDGDNYTIADYVIERNGTSYMGLFGNTNRANIHNTVIDNATVYAQDTAGSLVGRSANTSVKNCHAKNSLIKADSSNDNKIFGGLIGYSADDGDNGVIDNCSVQDSDVKGSNETGGLVGNSENPIYRSHVNSTEVVSSWNYVGGFVGNNSAYVNESYSTANVTGKGAVGGFVGINDVGGDIEHSASFGDVTGILKVGGFVGWNEQPIRKSFAKGDVKNESGENLGGFVGHNADLIYNSYATGDVTGDDDIGGFGGYAVGDSEDPSVCNNSYSIGYVEGNSNTGGFLGRKDDTYTYVEKSYFDTETSGHSSGESDGGEGYSTLTMQNIDLYDTNYWNITTVDWGEYDRNYIWNIVNDGTYPYLSFEEDFEGEDGVDGDYYLSLDSTAGGEVTDPGEASFLYSDGYVADLHTETEHGYIFDEWTGENGTVGDTSTSDTDIEILDHYNITARFRLITKLASLTPDNTTWNSTTMKAEIQELNVSQVDIHFSYRREGTSTWNDTSAESFDSAEEIQNDLWRLKPNTSYEYKIVAEWSETTLLSSEPLASTYTFESSPESFTTDNFTVELIPGDGEENVSVSQDVKLIFPASMNTSTDVFIEQYLGDTVNYGDYHWESTEYENDTIVWTHGDWSYDDTIGLTSGGYVTESGYEVENIPEEEWVFQTGSEATGGAGFFEEETCFLPWWILILILVIVMVGYYLIRRGS